MYTFNGLPNICIHLMTYLISVYIKLPTQYVYIFNILPNICIRVMTYLISVYIY